MTKTAKIPLQVGSGQASTGPWTMRKHHTRDQRSLRSSDNQALQLVGLMPVPSAGVTRTREAEPSWGWSFLGNFMYFPSLLLLDMQNIAAMEFMMPRELFEKVSIRHWKDNKIGCKKVAEEFGIDYMDVIKRGTELDIFNPGPSYTKKYN